MCKTYKQEKETSDIPMCSVFLRAPSPTKSNFIYVLKNAFIKMLSKWLTLHTELRLEDEKCSHFT